MPKPSDETPPVAQALARVLDAPHLARIVPQLPPELVQRVIDEVGLDDCGPLVALTTPAQLRAVFDLDLWHHPRPGQDDHFDAVRFGVWIEILVELGADLAARRIAAMDLALVTAGFAGHIRVFDPATRPSAEMADGDEMPTEAAAPEHGAHDVAGYTVLPRRMDAWDAIVAALLALAADEGPFFHQLMRRCRDFSNSAPEVDGLDDLMGVHDQAIFDLGIDRESRRAAQGYETPANARAFLQTARTADASDGAHRAASPIVASYFRSLNTREEASPAGGEPSVDTGAPPARNVAPDTAARDVAAFVEALAEVGITTAAPRALLDTPDDGSARLGHIRAYLSEIQRDHAAIANAEQELAYLANVLVVGCPVQGRPFTPQEASDAVTATCNIGLQNWAGPSKPADLVQAFQLGWSFIHRQVCVRAADRLVQALTTFQCADRETQSALNGLRRQLTKHRRSGTPWQAAPAMDILAVLDTPTWAVMLGLIAECPVIHAAMAASQAGQVRAIRATDFAFISETQQVTRVHSFLEGLPARLS